MKCYIFMSEIVTVGSNSLLVEGSFAVISAKQNDVLG